MEEYKICECSYSHINDKDILKRVKSLASENSYSGTIFDRKDQARLLYLYAKNQQLESDNKKLQEALAEATERCVMYECTLIPEYRSENKKLREALLDIVEATGLDNIPTLT